MICAFGCVLSSCFSKILGPAPILLAMQALFEMYFVFAAIWAFGGALVEKDGIDYRRQFDKWWKATWTTVKMPGGAAWCMAGVMEHAHSPCQATNADGCKHGQLISESSTACHHSMRPHIAGKGSVYDYYVNPKTAKFTPWAELVADVAYNSATTQMGSVFVPTSETSSLRFFLDIMVGRQGASQWLYCCVAALCSIASHLQGPCFALLVLRSTARACVLLTSSHLQPDACTQVGLGKPIMFVGGAGVGKTQLVKGKLAGLPEEMLSLAISFNYFTDVASFQKVRQLDWRACGVLILRGVWERHTQRTTVGCSGAPCCLDPRSLQSSAHELRTRVHSPHGPRFWKALLRRRRASTTAPRAPSS